MPLTRIALGWGRDKSTCIKTAHFGVSCKLHYLIVVCWVHLLHSWGSLQVPSNLNISDPQLINGFSGFMRTQLGLPFHPTRPTVPHVCLIRRLVHWRSLMITWWYCTAVERPVVLFWMKSLWWLPYLPLYEYRWCSLMDCLTENRSGWMPSKTSVYALQLI